MSSESNDSILIVLAHQSAYKAEILTVSHKLNLVSKFDGIHKNAAQLISQLVESNTSTFMPNPINMFHILYNLPVSRHPEYSASLTDVIPFLDSAEQSNTTSFLSESKC